jgi:hypothetical protein
VGKNPEHTFVKGPTYRLLARLKVQCQLQRAMTEAHDLVIILPELTRGGRDN